MPTYVVKDTSAVQGEPKDRLVEAANKASARNHVSRDRFKVEVAGTADIVRITKDGGELEVATGAAEQQAESEESE